MKRKRIVLTSLTFLFLTCWIYAQEEELKKYPGYVDLEEIIIPENAGEITDVTLGPAMLRMVRRLSAGDKKDEVSKSVNGFISIRVKSFSLDTMVESSVMAKIKPVMNRIENKLRKDNWESLVRVKEKNNMTNISVKFNEKGKAQGLLIMSLEPGDKASFVNIVGDIDINQLGNFGVSLDESALDSLNKVMKK